MLAWVAREYYTGLGAIVELGSFIGGSTARLAWGLSARDRPVQGKIFAYDRFQCAEKDKEKLLYKKGLEPFIGEDILGISKSLLSEYSDHIVFCPGDVLDAKWTGGDIEILFVDVSKSYDLNDVILEQFFPSLVSGVSIVIQQDFLLNRTPWIVAAMDALRDCFDLVAYTEENSAIFLCLRRPSVEQLSRAMSLNLTPERIEKAYRSYIREFPAERQKEILAHALLTFQEQQSVSEAWRFKPPTVTEDVIRDITFAR